MGDTSEYDLPYVGRVHSIQNPNWGSIPRAQRAANFTLYRSVYQSNRRTGHLSPRGNFRVSRLCTITRKQRYTVGPYFSLHFYWLHSENTPLQYHFFTSQKSLLKTTQRLTPCQLQLQAGFKIFTHSIILTVLLYAPYSKRTVLQLYTVCTTIVRLFL